MEPPNRLLRVGLLIGAAALVDAALGFLVPPRFSMQVSGLIVVVLFLGSTASQIAALSIWVALGSGGGARRALVAFFGGSIIAIWFIGKAAYARSDVPAFIVLFCGVALAVLLLFLLLRVLGLRIIPSEQAQTAAGRQSLGPAQFSLRSLLAASTVAGLLAAGSKLLYSTFEQNLQDQMLTILAIHIIAYLALAPAAAWVAWSGQLALFRVLSVGAAVCPCLLIPFAPERWVQSNFRFVVLGLSSDAYVLLLTTCLWLFRRCGYEAVWRRRAPAIVG